MHCRIRYRPSLDGLEVSAFLHGVEVRGWMTQVLNPVVGNHAQVTITHKLLAEEIGTVVLLGLVN